MKKFICALLVSSVFCSVANAAVSTASSTKLESKKEERLARLDKNAIKNFDSATNQFTVLSAKDIKTYKRLFKYQRALRRDLVAKEIKNLDDKVLYGHLMAERLLHPKTKASYKDLKFFLDNYNDQHQAKTIYKLANLRKPKASNGHNKPVKQTRNIANYSDPDNNLAKPKNVNVKNNLTRKRLIRNLRSNIKQKNYVTAERILNSNKNRKVLGDSTYTKYGLRLVKSLFNEQKYKDSYRVAQKLATVVKPMPHEAVWFEGLSAYHTGKYITAANTFRRLASNVPAGSKYYSQGSYWAGLSYKKANKKSMSKVFFRQAAKNKFDFYGMIANEELGQRLNLAWDEPQASKSEINKLMSNKRIRRVVALAEIGEHDLAQKELRAAYSSIPYGMDEALLKLTLETGLSWNSMTLSYTLLERNKKFLPGLYPDIKKWKPKNATVDYSLINAIIRQESAFSPSVKSSAGAMGLMQIMPGTAQHIRHKQGKRALPKSYVYRPDINVKLGQYYIGYLLEEFNGNLIYAIAAYNAGPGNVKKWIDRGLGNDGPVAFVEAIPFPETKKYVQKVMSNYWVYRNKFDQSLSTLRQVSSNHWPKDTYSLVFRLK
jgi:soluble lytic murein transglycosylase-like protein